MEITDVGVIVRIRRRARSYRCPCGAKISGRYDRSVRRWRHNDLGLRKVWLEAEVARVWCPVCARVRTEEVPWARPGARHTRDFEDTVVWLAQRMDKTSLAHLMRCSWDAVQQIVTRVVADRLDDDRLNGLVRIGVDEISYKRGHRYLTVVVDHDTGRVVWVGQGRSLETMDRFFDELGPQRAARLEAVTMDGSSTYLSATRSNAPNATICMDAFHVIQWANEALDAAFRASQIPTVKAQMRESRNQAPWRKARFALRAARHNIKREHVKLLKTIRVERKELHRAYLLKEELRDLYQIVEPEAAYDYLAWWVKRAAASGIIQMENLARKILGHFDSIVAAVELGLSNSRSEGTNTKIRVIQRRGYGYPNPTTLTAMIYLCCSGMNIWLPMET